MKGAAIRDLSFLTKALKTLLVLYGLSLLLSLWSERLEFWLLRPIADGGVVAEEQANQNDLRQFLVGSWTLVVWIVTAVIFLRWLFLQSRNAHQLASPMRFSPGWTVGWLFVPIATLWKPYQAMVELFRASTQSASRPWFLPVWWGLWILSNLFGNAVLRATLGTGTVDQLLRRSTMFSVGHVLAVALTIAAWFLVGRLQAYQAAKIGAITSDPRWLFRAE